MSQAIALARGSFLSTHTDRAVSDEGAQFRRNFERIVDDVFRSSVLGGQFAATVACLREAASEASVENWDGYGARPVNQRSILQAVRLLKALPTTLVGPEVSINPSGNVMLEWYREPKRSLTVSVGGDGSLVYAGIFGSSNIHGVEHFGDELPETIDRTLGRLFS